MFTTAVNLILKSSLVMVNTDLVKKKLVGEVMWKCVGDNFPGAVSGLKKGLDTVGYDLKPFYDVLGHQSYSNFNFSEALVNFQKADNKTKSAECLYEHESPSVLSLPFSLNCPNFEIIRNLYENNLQGLEKVDER